MGIMVGSLALSGCAGAKAIMLPVEDGKMAVPKSSFTVERKGKIKELRHVVLQNASMKYPVVLYKYSETEYKAMLLRCTHQGTELNVYGDLIACPAHGSEFTNKGGVIEGPAKEQLKAFNTELRENHIIISLS